MDPVTSAAAITAGGSILGGMLGGSESGAPSQLARNQFKYQKQLHQNQIQWQVADAKKAGLHPLFALGNSMNFSPVSDTSSTDTTGSALGQGIAEAGRQVGNLVGQKSLVSSQVKANDAAAERDYASAALSLSNMKRAENEANFRQDNAINTQPDFKHTPVPKIPTRKLERGTQKGKQPFFTEYELGSGYSFYGPRAEEPAEALENVGGMLMSLPKNALHVIRGTIGPYQRLAERIWNMKYSKGTTRKQRRYK